MSIENNSTIEQSRNMPKGNAKSIPKGWVETTLGEVSLINPRENIAKGTLAPNIPMAFLEAFSKKIQNFEWKKFKGGTKFKNGDTLLARITPCLENGKTAFVDILDENEIGFGSTEYIILREKEKYSDKHFLFYFSISPKFREIAIKLMTGTSGRQRVQTNSLIEKKFYFPPIEEQKAIAQILTAFDDKIELLQTQNKTLETTAQTIFKEWFGKYQIGDELPEGWRVGKYGKLANHLKESVKPFEHLDKDFVHYSLPAFDDGLVPIIENGKQIKSNKYAVKNNTILVSKLNPFTPRVWTIFKAKDNHICSTEFQVFEPKKPFYFTFLHSFLNSKFYTREISKNIQGTSSSHQRVRPEDILNLKLIIPTDEKIKDFEKTVGSLILKKEINYNQIQTLKQTRDTLLPKLMSGQLRVDEFKEGAA